MVTIEKCPLNNIVSTPEAKHAMADIKDFYLNNNLSETEYTKMHIIIIPGEIWQEYDDKRWVYITIYKVQ